MTEIRRRLGLAWNALRHGEPVRVTIILHYPENSTTDSAAVGRAIRRHRSTGGFDQ